MTNQSAQTMPEPVTASMCPSSDYAKGWNDCLAALSQTAGVAEPNGKLVGWWNGIMPDVTERSPYGPSVRWGADTEDSAHDIPLYDGYNPIHYRQPGALAAAPAARVDDRVQRLIDEARRCAGSTGDLSDLRAALMPFEGDY